MKNLKDKVKEFLETDFDGGDYSSICKAMFNTEYPEEGSKWNGEYEKQVLAKAKELNLQVDLVDDYGGEGQGDVYWSVYSFTDGMEVVYVKFNGWYASHYGSEYEDYFFVKPKQVTVTQFENE